MKKIVLASVAASALIAGLAVAKAEEPGEAAYFHERGNINAAQARGPAPSLDGTYQYGYQSQGFAPDYAQGTLGYAPAGDYYDDE